MAKKMQLGATPGKLALVAILAVTFVVVLVFQFGGFASQSTAQAVPHAPKAAAQRSTSAARATPVATAGKSSTERQRRTVKPVALKLQPLPKFSREEAASYDPFSRPHHLRVTSSKTESPEVDIQRRQQAERERALAEVREFEVAAIFQSGTDLVAVIDDQTIRVGDVFQGFRVTDIQPDGIKLEEQH